MNRNKLINTVIEVTKKYLTPHATKSLHPTKFYVPTTKGKLMLNDNTRIEYININDNSITVDIYNIDKNGDFITGTATHIYSDVTQSRVLTHNQMLDIITNINKLYNT